MTYLALQSFTGIMDGAEVKFARGDVIGADAAAEMNLAAKPDVAEPVKKGKS